MNTKDRIISAAIKNFLNFGYEKTSLASIAEEVGIKKPSIYYHFKNKKELFNISLKNILESLEYNILKSTENCTSSKEMFESLFSTLLEFHIQLSVMIDKKHIKPVNIFATLFSTLDAEDYKNSINNYYNLLNNTIIHILSIGQKRNEIRIDIKKDSICEQIMAWFEGLLILSSLYSSFNFNIAKQEFLDNLWILIGKTKKAKTISLGTKW
ncbi:transcriptional regulator, TetR family [Caminicella sporogenes DSM 14501]|uniref:Transcriptional regulator, TetR family n=1 Tax=Caminicella sporogenes DSM 14501 TaxID=1121266 RepID=A0A1M6PUB4_9FIRM|nr:TetR/AcrR family transcriptional regulator [Caminicella sporogenes]RKD21970.1 hypothetical protein BET04_06885 [Caminicella sporogenes]SHK11563.1 transcriptional regulator, TetR family [Caminicella sporogenes DSM 14501]